MRRQRPVVKDGFMPAFLPLTRADGNYKMPENPVLMERKI
jgi:hypothetical protein